MLLLIPWRKWRPGQPPVLSGVLLVVVVVVAVVVVAVGGVLEEPYIPRRRHSCFTPTASLLMHK